DFLSDELLRTAHRRGMEVHVWTVNDAGQMTRQIKRGVDNIITSDPDVAIRVRDEWANMTGTERLELTSRLLLGLDPGVTFAVRGNQPSGGRSTAARRALACRPHNRPGSGRLEASGSPPLARGSAAPAGSPNRSGGIGRPIRRPPVRTGPGSGGAAPPPAAGRTD